MYNDLDLDIDYSVTNQDTGYEYTTNYNRNSYYPAPNRYWDIQEDGYQRHISYPEPNKVRLNEYINLPGFSYHGELYGPSDIYEELKKSVPISPVYTKMLKVDEGETPLWDYKDICTEDRYGPVNSEWGLLSEEYNENVNPYEEFEEQCQTREYNYPCRCGVDSNWAEELPDDLDVCRTSCCRQDACQPGVEVTCFPRGTCRSDFCPRVANQCYRDCTGRLPQSKPCYPRYPENPKEESKQPLPPLTCGGLIGGEGGGGGRGGHDGGRHPPGKGYRESGNKRGGKGGHKGIKNREERVQKVTDYESVGGGSAGDGSGRGLEGTATGDAGGGNGIAGGGSGGGGTDRSGGPTEKGPAGGFGGPAGGAGGPTEDGSYGQRGTDGDEADAYCLGPPSVCPGRNVCKGPRRACPGPTSTCPGPKRCLGPRGFQYQAIQPVFNAQIETSKGYYPGTIGFTKPSIAHQRSLGTTKCPGAVKSVAITKCSGAAKSEGITKCSPPKQSAVTAKCASPKVCGAKRK